MEWTDYRKNVCCWVDVYSNRRKTWEALYCFYARKGKDLNLEFMIFAPQNNIWGSASSCNLHKSGNLIYLSPQLERKKQTFIERVIAHEMAHVFLKHVQIGTAEAKAEKEAETQIKAWGY